ncbi:MAG TPA: transglutaminase family protein [Bryobacteraceae bacterium]|nr:transglutaminase family protein [Bryobacteraceae bacterium]
MVYRASHTTRHIYEESVAQSVNELRLTPRGFGQQSVREVHIEVTPEPALWRTRKDWFGNEVTTFSIFEPHDRFTVTASSVVEVLPANMGVLPTLRWEEARDILAEGIDDPALEASEFIYSSPFVATSPELAAYAKPSFAEGRPLVEALEDLSHRVYKEFRYAPKSTSIDMPLGEVLKNRKGVCQDFSHVMIGALRSLRLAARYVSGYLRSGAKYQGAEASHAWVAAFVPGAGWLHFDPTNDIIPSEGHVTLGWGRDYGDVTPVKGVTLGGGSQLVEVAVRVEPITS